MNLQEITDAMAKLKGWSLEGTYISKNLDFSDFKEALDFVNEVGKLAEKHEHHPDILLKYGKVRLVLSTHSVKGLTEKDFELAENIDKI